MFPCTELLELPNVYLISFLLPLLGIGGSIYRAAVEQTVSFEFAGTD